MTKNNTTKLNINKLIISFILPISAGLIGSLFTFQSIPTWYASLQKPFFNPPNWIFGPVWTTLYILMGLSFYMVWKGKKNNKEAMQIYLLQLLFNTSWSIIFFGLQNIFGGLVVIVILWTLILKTILEFLKVNKISSYLLIPYLLWVSFATVLNFMIYILNR